MPRTKEISEDLRLRIDYLHKVGKGLYVHQRTVRQIVYNFSTVAALPRSGHPAKATARAQRRMLNEVN